MMPIGACTQTDFAAALLDPQSPCPPGLEVCAIANDIIDAIINSVIPSGNGGGGGGGGGYSSDYKTYRDKEREEEREERKSKKEKILIEDSVIVAIVELTLKNFII